MRGNTWFLSYDFNGSAEKSFVYGLATDRPIAGDWDGSGVTDPGIVRANKWYLNNGFDGTPEMIFSFGSATDLPIAGDWDGSAS